MNVNELQGKIITEIFGMYEGSDSIIFVCEDGTRYKMFHDQDCCETVKIESVTGDDCDLLNTRISLAEEVTNYSTKDKPKNPDSYTYTFYKFGTIKGYVDLRWLGESNGYYSESVDFVKLEQPND